MLEVGSKLPGIVAKCLACSPVPVVLSRSGITRSSANGWNHVHACKPALWETKQAERIGQLPLGSLESAGVVT